MTDTIDSLPARRQTRQTASRTERLSEYRTNAQASLLLEQKRDSALEKTYTKLPILLRNPLTRHLLVSYVLPSMDPKKLDTMLADVSIYIDGCNIQQVKTMWMGLMMGLLTLIMKGYETGRLFGDFLACAWISAYCCMYFLFYNTLFTFPFAKNGWKQVCRLAFEAHTSANHDPTTNADFRRVMRTQMGANGVEFGLVDMQTWSLWLWVLQSLVHSFTISGIFHELSLQTGFVASQFIIVPLLLWASTETTPHALWLQHTHLLASYYIHLLCSILSISGYLCDILVTGVSLVTLLQLVNPIEIERLLRVLLRHSKHSVLIILMVLCRMTISTRPWSLMTSMMCLPGATLFILCSRANLVGDEDFWKSALVTLLTCSILIVAECVLLTVNDGNLLDTIGGGEHRTVGIGASIVILMFSCISPMAHVVGVSYWFLPFLVYVIVPAILYLRGRVDHCKIKHSEDDHVPICEQQSQQPPLPIEEDNNPKSNDAKIDDPQQQQQQPLPIEEDNNPKSNDAEIDDTQQHDKTS